VDGGAVKRSKASADTNAKNSASEAPWQSLRRNFATRQAVERASVADEVGTPALAAKAAADASSDATASKSWEGHCHDIAIRYSTMATAYGKENMNAISAASSSLPSKISFSITAASNACVKEAYRAADSPLHTISTAS